MENVTPIVQPGASAADAGQQSSQSEEQVTSEKSNADPNRPAGDAPNTATATGDVKGPPKGSPSFAQQLHQQGQQQEAPKPNIAAPQAASDETKRADFQNMSSKDCVKKAILNASKEAAISSALAMHKGDTKAVAVTVVEAMQEVFAKDFMDPKSVDPNASLTPGSTFDSSNKFVTQAVLGSMSTPEQKKYLENTRKSIVKICPSHAPISGNEVP